MSVSRVAGVLADLHLLTVIAQTRSLTQAARRLGISKASVSTRLRELEQLVGMSLVRRTTRSVTLTAAAAQLVDDMQAAFTRIEQSFEHISVELRSQYIVGYYTHESPYNESYRTTAVTVLRPDLTIICKDGYYPSAADNTRARPAPVQQTAPATPAPQ